MEESNLDLPEETPIEKTPEKSLENTEFYKNLEILASKEDFILDSNPVIYRLVSVMIKASAFIFSYPDRFRFNETVALNAVVKRLRNMMPGDYT